jgi:RNA polymerase sigma factor (sigma-70 family)
MMVGSMKKLEETEQLAILTHSNQLALESLFDSCYDRIYAFCVHRLFCRTAAEDITSQIFLNAAKGFGSIAGQESETQVRWLYGIATNQCNSYIRQHLRRRKIFEKYQTEYKHQPDEVEPTPDWTHVYAGIAQLKEIEQTVITLRFFEEMSYDEIAAIIKKRQNSVRVILHRGLKKLRKLLNSATCGFEDRGIDHE